MAPVAASGCVAVGVQYLSECKLHRTGQLAHELTCPGEIIARQRVRTNGRERSHAVSMLPALRNFRKPN
ncbi:hypothetical protein C7S15_8297 [Burkholderia cepacia]|nr:hypothetical protein [Burkholderia cepacia]